MPCEIGELPKKEAPMTVEHTETKIEMDEDAHDEDEVRGRERNNKREGRGRQLSIYGDETAKWNPSITDGSTTFVVCFDPFWFIVGTLCHANFPVVFCDLSKSLQIASKTSSDHSGPEDDYKIDTLFYRICYVSENQNWRDVWSMKKNSIS